MAEIQYYAREVQCPRNKVRIFLFDILGNTEIVLE